MHQYLEEHCPNKLLCWLKTKFENKEDDQGLRRSEGGIKSSSLEVFEVKECSVKLNTYYLMTNNYIFTHFK